MAAILTHHANVSPLLRLLQGSGTDNIYDGEIVSVIEQPTIEVEIEAESLEVTLDDTSQIDVELEVPILEVEIEEDPASFAFQPCGVESRAALGLEACRDLAGESLGVPQITGGRDDKIVEDRRQLAHVKHSDIPTAVVACGLRGGQSELQTAL